MGKVRAKKEKTPEDYIVSPRSWLPPVTVDAQQLLITKTFKGDPLRSDTAFFGGTVRRARLRAVDRSLLERFFADRFARMRDDGCRRLVCGPVFDPPPAPAAGATARLGAALGPLGMTVGDAGGGGVRTATAEELLSYVEEPDERYEWLGSGEVHRRRVELLAACMGWQPLAALPMSAVEEGVERYSESAQEILLGRPALVGATALVMAGRAACRMTPRLLLANAKRREVEAWRDGRRREARGVESELETAAREMQAESEVIDALILSPKAWTRAGQAEIAGMKRQLQAKEARRAELEDRLKTLRADAEMDVKSVLEGMWTSASDEERKEYEEEFAALALKYAEPMPGQRVRLTALAVRRVRLGRNGGAVDPSLAPGACDAMRGAAGPTRWFNNVVFAPATPPATPPAHPPPEPGGAEGGGGGAGGAAGGGRREVVRGAFPDIRPGSLAREGGVGTVKLVHRDGERVMVGWDRTGRLEWYNTGCNAEFALALCDQDEGRGTTGCLEGLSSLRLLTNRVDVGPDEAATRTYVRKVRGLGRTTLPEPSTDPEGGKHQGRPYDRLTGTGYL